MCFKIREAFQSKKQRNLGLYWNGLTPPLKSTWDFFELGIFLKWNDPLKNFRNKLNMKTIGTKSINMSDIMVYLAMFSTIIDQILFFGVHIRWKWIIIVLVFGTLWNLGLFWFRKIDSQISPPFSFPNLKTLSTKETLAI